MKNNINIAVVGLGQVGIYLLNELNIKKKDIELKTGKKIKDILDYVFQKYNLDWTDFVQIDKNLLRDGDSKKIISDPRKIKNELNWETKITFEQMLDRCIGKIEKSY